MSQHPDWLPALVLFKDSGNVWQDYLAVLYGWFRVDFVDSKPDWPGKRVGLKRKPLYDGKEATFWHFIQEGPEEAERMPDLRRCERIRWPRKVIDRFEEKNPSPEIRSYGGRMFEEGKIDICWLWSISAISS